MKLLWNDKDGGPESRVWCWGIEIKPLFSILLLKFNHGSREVFHTHAFNSISWVIKGALQEFEIINGLRQTTFYFPSIKPVFTYRSTLHMVHGCNAHNWVLTFRGPWKNRWLEMLPRSGRVVTLTHGRKEVQ